MQKSEIIIAALDKIVSAAKLVIEAIKDIQKEIKAENEVKKIEVQPEEVKVIETKKVVTLEEVRTVLANLSRKGHTTEVKALLQKYGSEKLSTVDPANYEALLKDAEEIENAN